jgi:hypothetical protein
MESLKDLGYRAPPKDAPLRLAFVGQGNYFRSMSLEGPAAGIQPAFIQFRARTPTDSMLRELHEFDPHVVIVFRPEFLPEGTLSTVAAPVIGYVTEPLPRPGEPEHPDLVRRRKVFGGLDPSQLDRIVSYDPYIEPTIAEIVPVWRSLPLPVADSFYTSPSQVIARAEAIFVGKSTPRREQLLIPAKHFFEVIHLAHGISGARLREFLAECGVGINVHNQDYPAFEHRVPMYQAAGLLVLTEPLSPTHGLSPGKDYLEVGSAQELYETLSRVMDDPAAFLDIRLSGRQKAELFRASRVYPDLVRDLFSDLAAHGTRRLTVS